MENKFAKLKRLNSEYTHLLGLLNEIPNKTAVKLEQLGNRIKFFEERILELKERIKSDGIIDVNI